MGAAVVVLIILVATFFYGTLVGWFVHWVLHQRWSGPLYRSHINHHLKQYPPSDLLSDEYRSAGADNGVFVFTPFITLLFGVFGALLVVLGVAPWVLILVATEAIVIGFLHDWVHTQFHLRKSRLEQYPWFADLQRWHFYHHWNVRKNLGIFWFGWDRVFGTFRSR